MLKTRIISACVFVPVILIAAYFGSWLWAALVLAIAVVGGYEFGKIAEAKGHSFFSLIYYPVAVVVVGLAQLFPENLVLMLGALFLGFAAFLTMFVFGKCSAEDAALNITAVVYIPITMACAILLRSGYPDGMWYIFLLLIIQWFTDSGAYLIGSSIGKHKLMPRVSPKKSVEGAVGGVVVAVIGALLLNAFIHIFPVSLMTVLAIVVSVGGQLGDLCESAFKRWAGVKDSGKCIPGHGGMLDRFDSMLFAAPLLLLFISLFAELM